MAPVPPATFGLGEAHALRARLANEPRMLVLLRSDICPYGAAFRPAFFELAKKHGFDAVDHLVSEVDAAQWDAFGMRVSPTVLLVERGREAARLEGILLLGLTRQKYAKWLKGLA